MRAREDEYPRSVCSACAISNGGKWPKGHMATFHIGKCDWCRKIQPVTEPRDYGYPEFTIKRVTNELGLDEEGLDG